MNYPEHTTAAIETTVAHLRATADQRRREADQSPVSSYAHLLREQAEILEHLAGKLAMERVG